jgi:hypothetical protein
MRTEPRKKRKREQKRLIKNHPSVTLLELEKEMGSGWVDTYILNEGTNENHYIGGLTFSHTGKSHWKKMKKLTEQN